MCWFGPKLDWKALDLQGSGRHQPSPPLLLADAAGGCRTHKEKERKKERKKREREQTMHQASKHAGTRRQAGRRAGGHCARGNGRNHHVCECSSHECSSSYGACEEDQVLLALMTPANSVIASSSGDARASANKPPTPPPHAPSFTAVWVKLWLVACKPARLKERMKQEKRRCVQLFVGRNRVPLPVLRKIPSENFENRLLFQGASLIEAMRQCSLSNGRLPSKRRTPQLTESRVFYFADFPISSEKTGAGFELGGAR